MSQLVGTGRLETAQPCPQPRGCVPVWVWSIHSPESTGSGWGGGGHLEG